jgi:GAF domain-containing protein
MLAVAEQGVVRAVVELADPLQGREAGAAHARMCACFLQLLDADAAVLHLLDGGVPRVAAVAGDGPEPGGEADGLDAVALGAVRAGGPLQVVDVERREWPALLSAPLCRSGEALAVVTLLRREAQGWTDTQRDDMATLAQAAAVGLSTARALHAATELAGHLQRALDSRVLIEQAKGMIAARDSLDMQGAFARLRAYSRNNGRKLHDVARDVVEGRITLP